MIAANAYGAPCLSGTKQACYSMQVDAWRTEVDDTSRMKWIW